MTENPYQSPRDDALPRDRSLIGLRSYHLPFIIAAVCGLALGVICSVTFANQKHFAVCVSVVGIILLFDLPVCGLVVYEWWRTGEPPKLNFEPLVDSAECRALRRTLRQRPLLDDEAFYRAYYADSGIAKQIVIAMRRELQEMLGRSLAGVHPNDDMGLLEPELDFADLFDELSDAFDIVIPWRTREIDIDGTFDSLVRLVADRASTNAMPE